MNDKCSYSHLDCTTDPLTPNELNWIITLLLSKCIFTMTPEHLTEKTQQRRKKYVCQKN